MYDNMTGLATDFCWFQYYLSFKAPIFCKKRKYITSEKWFWLTLLSSVLILHKRQVNFKLNLLWIKLTFQLLTVEPNSSHQRGLKLEKKPRKMNSIIKEIILLRQCQNCDAFIISFVVLSLSSSCHVNVIFESAFISDLFWKGFKWNSRNCQHLIVSFL